MLPIPLAPRVPMECKTKMKRTWIAEGHAASRALPRIRALWMMIVSAGVAWQLSVLKKHKIFYETIFHFLLKIIGAQRLHFTGVDYTRDYDVASALKKDVEQGAKGMKLHPIFQKSPLSPVMPGCFNTVK